MKTTTDNHIDKLLHEAMKRRADKVPPLAEDFAEKVLRQCTSLPLTPSEGRGTQSRFSSLSFWRGRGVRLLGAVAASIVLLIAFNYNNKVVPEEAPVVAEVVEQPAPEPTEVPEPTKLTEPTKAAEPAEPTMPTKPKSKRIRKTPPQETAAPTEPVLAESMPMLEQAEDPLAKAVRVRKEIRQRGEQVEQYVAMLNERVKSEQHYVQF